MVDISRDNRLRAGTIVTFTCTVTPSSSMSFDQQNIEISWSGHERMHPRYTISEVFESDGRYTRSLTISPLSFDDRGETIECTGTVTGYNIQPVSSNTTVDLDIIRKLVRCLELSNLFHCFVSV